MTEENWHKQTMTPEMAAFLLDCAMDADSASLIQAIASAFLDGKGAEDAVQCRVIKSEIGMYLEFSLHYEDSENAKPLVEFFRSVNKLLLSCEICRVIINLRSFIHEDIRCEKT